MINIQKFKEKLMNMEKFLKIVSLSEDRAPDVDYTDEPTKVSAASPADANEVISKLNQQATKIKTLEGEIDRLKNELEQSKTIARDNLAALFDAADEVKTREVQTVSFILSLSKAPKPTVTPKYKEILEELSTKLTPELILVLENLKQTMVTVKQHAPSLKIGSKDISENVGNKYEMLADTVTQWSLSYGKDLANLIKQAVNAE